MEDIKGMARAAKKRLKSNFWADCKKNSEELAVDAINRGMSEIKVKSRISDKVKNEISGEKQDDFYIRVKTLLDTEGEVSDAIGRLTDRDVYDKLSYEEKQRYNLQLSTKYLNALSRYKNEKELEL